MYIFQNQVTYIKCIKKLFEANYFRFVDLLHRGVYSKGFLLVNNNNLTTVNSTTIIFRIVFAHLIPKF
jgi:hypothetical protein